MVHQANARADGRAENVDNLTAVCITVCNPADGAADGGIQAPSAPPSATVCNRLQTPKSLKYINRLQPSAHRLQNNFHSTVCKHISPEGRVERREVETSQAHWPMI